MSPPVPRVGWAPEECLPYPAYQVGNIRRIRHVVALPLNDMPDIS